MLIDWFTVAAQALNFVILVWLLKRFLYKPILDALDARENRIAAELADAAAKQAEAQQERDQFQRKNDEFDQARAALLGKATDEAKAERQRLFEAARTAAEALSRKRQETLRNDAENLNQAIVRRTQQEVFAIARKALADLAGASLEQRMVEVFVRKLGALDAEVKDGLAQALASSSEPALLRSAFDLPAEQQATLQQALNDSFGGDIKLRYETAPDLVSGIEFSTSGQKLAWSIADYLVSLEEGIGELLKAKAAPETTTEPKTEAKVEPKSELKSEPKVASKDQAVATPAKPATRSRKTKTGSKQQ
ncbi:MULTISPECIES: ATP synthase subunit B [Rhodopseudomonas]|uniref:F0F1 ATP synthase subunit B family protein n=1 Tax=Rhodopseudomonas TaxID=1073 RepID=UPI0005C8965A|nr:MULTISPECIES: ATP synthase subunit B [Rhodopseudomonas]MDF3809569.1 hypothetical protein [Rhodopseudomonas sp. BAL398]WOK17767.1 hypothetical protein RBJ75_27240 [Rhodopseudomonas sp. BAL398]